MLRDVKNESLRKCAYLLPTVLLFSVRVTLPTDSKDERRATALRSPAGSSTHGSLSHGPSACSRRERSSLPSASLVAFRAETAFLKELPQ